MQQKLSKELSKLADNVLNLVYPRHCPICDEVLEPFSVKNGKIVKGPLVHSKCSGTIKRVSGITCIKCGKPLGGCEAEEEYCSDCKNVKHYFVRGFSAFEYRSISGSLYKFKYMGRQEYADFYAGEIAERYGRKIKSLGIDAIIPVPMYKDKENLRGYNQAEILARKISDRTGIPIYSKVITRKRNTTPMKELDSRGRRINLKRAFNISKNDVKFKCILIIDDIYTTGSTIDEIAHEFMIAGVQSSFFLTLAIGKTI